MYTVLQSTCSARKFLIGGMTALILGLASTALWASPPADDTRSVIVSYAELDVSRPVGAQVLYRRIQRAAYDVCDGYVGPFPERHIKTSPCYKNAVANAVAQVNSSQLSAIYRANMSRVASN
jgi:UrcA family protein